MKINVHTVVETPAAPTPPERQRFHGFFGSRPVLMLVLLASAGGAVFATMTLGSLQHKMADAKEAARPANIALTKITAPECADCFQLDQAVAALKKQNVSVTSEETADYTSEKGKQLIAEYGITKVPTYIASGEVTKNTITSFFHKNGSLQNNTFVLTNIAPIYIDVATSEQIGRVTAIIITDPSCPACIDPKATVDAYKRSGVTIVNEQTTAWNSPAGQNLIKKYAITKLPTLLLSKEIDAYAKVKANFQQLGSVESDGTYVIRSVALPYRDITKHTVVGLVDIIYLVDAACNECYKPEITQRNTLTRGYGMGFASEKTVDINSIAGKKLVNKYTITKVPTFLLSRTADEYSSLKRVWGNVGTIETDGWYVFRQQSEQDIYKDLTTNTVIKPQTGN